METESAPAIAKAAGLRYVSDAMPGIRRERVDGGFRYIAPDGAEITDEDELTRIRKLAIPPAYEDVWICPLRNGHLQATGRDARRRKQYRYHPRWREVRDETKYGRMIEFGKALPTIRERVERDLELPGLPREKVLATIVDLLEVTHLRIGNEEYAKENKSYGLTTLRNRHVRVDGSRVHFSFAGKHGIRQSVDVADRRIARIVKRCRDIPGQELFQYLAEDGTPQSIDSDDVNAYLREITGSDFTAKDFRTWAGTVACALALGAFDPTQAKTQLKHNVVEAITSVAATLGNTPSVCRKCYVHPVVIDSYLESGALKLLEERASEALRHNDPRLRPEEVAVLRFLEVREAAAVGSVTAPMPQRKPRRKRESSGSRRSAPSRNGRVDGAQNRVARAS